MQVVVSNGFHKFHLAFAAESLFQRGALALLITGAYPTGPWNALVRGFGAGNMPSYKRLLAREVAVDRDRVLSLFAPEICDLLGRALEANGYHRAGRWMQCQAMASYGRLARSPLLRAPSNRAKIYHYRSGFGGKSLAVAKEAGMYLICDHSIVHPGCIEYLVTNKGRMPIQKIFDIDTFWNNVLSDILYADTVLVNSNFVKDTFANQGWERNNLEVAYLGVDDEFLRYISRATIEQKLNAIGSTPTICFAGGLSKRKGGDLLIRSLKQIRHLNWKFTIAGSVEPSIYAENRDFFSDSRVGALGWIPRNKLAAIMSASNIFVFPSLAEGSARVVFEAMSAGCYIITTRNSGTIVSDGINGRIVTTGSVSELTDALTNAVRDPEGTSRIGRANQRVIEDGYRQIHYVNRLLNLYSRVLNEPDPSVTKGLYRQNR